MALDGTALGKDGDQRLSLYISHGFLNTLRAGFQGKLVALNIEAQIEDRAPEPAEINVLQAVLDEIGRWTAELWNGRPLLGREGQRHPSPDAPVALELLDELRADLLTLVPKIDKALAGEHGGARHLVAGLGRQAYTREHYTKGLIQWGEHFGPPVVADRYRQHLLSCKEDLRTAHRFLELLRQGALGAAEEAALRDTALLLGGIFRSQVHDMHVLIGLRRGGMSFRLSGIERPEADDWRDLSLAPEEAGYWKCYDFTPRQAAPWIEAGLDEPAVAAAWRLRGFDVAEAVHWHNQGHTARSALRELSANRAAP